ncbi:MAG: hypothetical protein JST55_15840 [Bacteroidetes bacterium]|nr:hypothetical protein [Bacteroidota bacterium]
MERIKRFPFNFILISSGIFLICLYIVSTQQFQSTNSFSTLAVTFDLTITLTLTYYFFIGRKYKLTPWTIIPVYIVSLIAANSIIPTSNHQFFSYFKELLIIPELFIIGLLFAKIRIVIKEFRSINYITTDFIEQLYRAIDKAVNSKIISSIFTTELSIVFYAATFWKNKKEVYLEQSFSTIHKKTGYSVFWFVIILMTIVETFSLHIFIGKYSNIAAWILTALSFYGVIFLTADFSAMVKRPIIITNDSIYLRSGMRWRVIIPLDKITSLQSIKNFKDDSKEYLNISAVKQPNALLITNKYVEVKGLYGITKHTTKIAFSIDDYNMLDRIYKQNKGYKSEVINS